LDKTFGHHEKLLLDTIPHTHNTLYSVHDKCQEYRKNRIDAFVKI